MTDDAPLSLYRRNVGIMVVNRNGKVLIAERADNPNAWQMPQGGLDENEDPWVGALRELEEEIGTRAVTYLGCTEMPLRYDFPPQTLKRFKGRYVGQEQIWFAVHFLGQDTEINLNTTDHAEFRAWRWAEFAEVLDLIVDFKRPVYEEVLRHFAKFAGPINE